SSFPTRLSSDLELVDFVKNGSVFTIKADDRDVPADRGLTLAEAYLLYGKGSIKEKQELIVEGDSTKFKTEMNKWRRTTTIPWGDSVITETMAVKLDLISRDTVFVPVIQKLFTGPNAKVRDSDLPFDPDSLKYVAYSGGDEDAEFIYRWKKIENVIDSVKTYKYRFELRMKNPMKKQYSDNECEPKDELIMGSLETDKLTGNW